MNRALSLTLFAISFFLSANGQKPKVNYGIYEGYINSEVPTIWILNHDSTFIFISFEGNYIKYLDAGNWVHFEPGIIKFTFSEITFPILQNAIYQYNTESRAPYDSVFINGQIKSRSGKKIAYASIIVNGKYEITTDQNGYFSNVHPRIIGEQNITILKKIDGYETLTLPLNSNTNSHKLDITLPEIDSTSVDIAYGNNIFKQSLFNNKEIKIRYFNTPEKKMGHNSILFKSPNLANIIERLNLAKVNQPYLISNINQLLRILNK